MVKYFGYGANRDAMMMAAVIGRMPDGEQMVLQDYELRILPWKQIPKPARDVLKNAWSSSFSSYVVSKKVGARVSGTLWSLKKEELLLVDRWELVPKWYRRKLVKVGNRKIHCQIVESGGQVVDGMNYQTYLNEPEQMYLVAALNRR